MLGRVLPRPDLLCPLAGKFRIVGGRSAVSGIEPRCPDEVSREFREREVGLRVSRDHGLNSPSDLRVHGATLHSPEFAEESLAS